MAVGYFADAAYRRWYEEPLDAAQQRLAQFEKKLHDGKLDVRRQQNRLPELDALQPRSLPLNLDLAVTSYRSWLLQAIEGSGMQQANLDSGAPASVQNLYNRIDFSVRSRGTLSQLTEFLHRFYSTPYLHKIRSLSLTPSADGTLDVSLAIETLSIPSLAPDTELMEVATDHQGLLSREAYQTISQRNLFRAGSPPTADITLSAITLDSKQRKQVWLSFLKTGETRILSEGDDLALEGTHLKVTSIAQDQAQFAIDGQPHTVAIGDTLTN
jgi:hypothetical protein